MYEDKYNANQLFLNSKFGLQRVYEILAKNNIKGGLSLENFKNENNISAYDISFAEFLKQNFQNLDIDKNKAISGQEMDQLLNSIEKQGLTYEQLQSLASQGIYSGESKTLLSTVMENFNKIDINKDGRVSEAEINAYKFNKEVEDKRTELWDVKASNISVFYADSSSTSTDSTDSTEKKT